MRIVVDLQGAQTESRFRGIGRYAMGLTKAIVRYRGNHEIFLVLNDRFPDTIKSIRSDFDGLLPQEYIRVWNSLGSVYEYELDNDWRRRSAELIREAFLANLQPDVLYISSFFEGYVDDAVTSIGLFNQNIRTAVSHYDLIPLLNQDEYLRSNPTYKQFYLRKIDQLKRASLLLSISEFSRQEAIDHLGVSGDFIINVGTSAEDRFRPLAVTKDQRQEIFHKFGITRPFILYTGGADERKNLSHLVGAYAKLSADLRKGHQLVLAGRMPDGNVSQLRDAAQSAGLEEIDLIFTGYVTDEELVNFYNLCELYVFPSWHEGFGLPALEAMRCGAPVIAANTTSLPEVVGLEKALFDPQSEDSIASKMQQALTDDTFRTELANHGIKQAQKFSWDENAKRVIAAFENICVQNVETFPKTWQVQAEEFESEYRHLIDSIARIPIQLGAPIDAALVSCAKSISENHLQAVSIVRAKKLPEQITWRIEGPFDSSYSLALINRETARALKGLGHNIILHSTEGPGDFIPNENFLCANSDLNEMFLRSNQISSEDAHITSRNLYPPRVSDMSCRLNLLHHYAWEESGFPLEWVNDFNTFLQGITCLSSHVEKILIDHGVTVPLSVSGCGVDHWEHINPEKSYKVRGRSFKFLHVSSCFPRKGADLLLKAFSQVFTSEDDVTLIIKTFPNPHNEINRWLSEAKNEKADFPHVLIIKEELSDSQLKALYEQCQVLVAPSLAEGFGLPLAEAMLSGVAVITTSWSGQLDFCNHKTAWLVDYTFAQAKTHFNIYDSVWAVPDIGHLAHTMREVYELSESERMIRTKQGRRLLLEKFRWKNVAERLIESARRWSKIPLSTKTRIGWISTWNVRCGIASYSAHLVGNMSTDISIFAPYADDLTQSDGPNVVRCWSVGEHDSLVKLVEQIEKADIKTLVIQFNYGFFNFDHFYNFLMHMVDVGLTVVVTMHSTTDPVHVPDKKLLKLKKSLGRCHRILAHSLGDLNRLKSLGIINNVTLFPHGIPDYEPPPRQSPPSTTSFLIASYGFFLPNKGLIELIDAFALLRVEGIDAELRMINAEYPVPSSAELICTAKKKITQLGLDNRVQMNTDYLPDNESISLLADADLIVFPYQQTGESSSAAVRYGIATGRPVAVSPSAIFDDVASAVIFLPGERCEEIAHGIKKIFHEITNDSDSMHAKIKEANRWREAHRYSRLSIRIEGMLQALQTRADR